MRKILLIIILSAITLQISSSVVIFTAFQLNRNYISKNLCENRNNTEAHCNGNCHLVKELQKEEDNSGKLPASLYKQKINELFLEESIAFGASQGLLPIGRAMIYTPKPSPAHSGSIFHPPVII